MIGHKIYYVRRLDSSLDNHQMASKTKKEKPDIPETPENEDIRQKTLDLISSAVSTKLPQEMLIRIENGIEAASKAVDGEFNVMLYTILTVKIIENLKNDYVVAGTKDGIWRPEDLATLDKDTLNPTKWQQLQDTRLPKNIQKERKKGMYKCKRCGSWYSEYYSAQTRSSDEPMTLYFSCLDCGKKWKM